MKKALILYEDRRVSLIAEDAVFHQSIRSTVDSLIHEEIKTFIKQQTGSSFLYAPDYIHAFVPFTLNRISKNTVRECMARKLLCMKFLPQQVLMDR
jgi:hypothetical protein